MGEEGVAGLVRLLGQAEQQIGRRLLDIVTAHGTTAETWQLLALLADGVARSMREVGEAAAVPGPSLTRIVDRMVADGLVDRHTDTADRRRVLVSLTSRGRALHDRLAGLVAAESAALEERIGAVDLAETTRQLERLCTRVDP